MRGVQSLETQSKLKRAGEPTGMLASPIPYLVVGIKSSNVLGVFKQNSFDYLYSFQRIDSFYVLYAT